MVPHPPIFLGRIRLAEIEPFGQSELLISSHNHTPPSLELFERVNSSRPSLQSLPVDGLFPLLYLAYQRLQSPLGKGQRRPMEPQQVALITGRPSHIGGHCPLANCGDLQPRNSCIPMISFTPRGETFVKKNLR